jgi:hypothetical protein
MRKTLTGLLAGMAWLLSAALVAAEISAQLLVYRISEPGTKACLSRLLVTPDYLRMDQGRQDRGFILLDRRARVIYNVDAQARMVLVIEPPRQNRGVPATLKHAASRQAQPDMPEVAGKTPEYWQFFVNDRLCRSAVVVPGLLPQASTAYREYLELLADQEMLTLAVMPPELQDACDMAIHVYTPLAVLEKGLPLREWHVSGWRQELLDLQDAFSIAAEGFRLPDDYRRLSLGEM